MQIVFPDIHGNYEVFMDCLQAIIGEQRESFIDLGCNKSTMTGLLTDFKKRKYVDILPRILDYPDEQQYFEQGDILETPLDVHYTVSMALDCCEHLTLKDGYKLFAIMEAISDKQIIFTPLDAWMMDEISTDPESHKSLWTPSMLPEYASWVFPSYHLSLGIGAWFGMKCEKLESEFERINNELKLKKWN